jgi:gamma-glutamyl-gamma-aminobutyrate hydrolase PuuD
LLDDLAVRFMEGGWSIKRLAREMVLSSTYRQSTSAEAKKTSIDATNELFSRMNRRRLSVEQWRDATLFVSGQLDDTGGKSLELDDPANHRRTVYARVSRLQLNDMLTQFDYPDANVHSEKRAVTTTATQKLFMLNSPFMLSQAKALSARVTSEIRESEQARVRRIYGLLFGREPEKEEVNLAIEFLRGRDAPDMSRWQLINERVRNPEGGVTIAIVGKYTGMKDAYKSLIEALSHGGIANKVKVNLDWIESEVFEKEDPTPFLEHVNGILVPGGFGQRGAEGKIKAAQFARERAVPYFGICFGMQMACIEAARNLCGIAEANSTEFGPTSEPIVGLMTEWLQGNELQKRAAGGDLGGTMRLGAYEAMLTRGSRVAQIYGSTEIWERHRHRYEVNTAYKGRLEQHGMRFSGMSPDGILPEIVEYEDHPWFIGVQFHPELKSRPFEPHPLFASFIDAAVVRSRLV